MKRLADFLRAYIRQRVNSHPAWKDVRVILSDASVPRRGKARSHCWHAITVQLSYPRWWLLPQGEHKIMQFIRSLRASPGYNPNTRHILHGLDADLIMLGKPWHGSPWQLQHPILTLAATCRLGHP